MGAAVEPLTEEEGGKVDTTTGNGHESKTPAEKTPLTFFSLPREIRDENFSLVWSSPGYVRLASEWTHKWALGGRYGGPTFKEEPAQPYPPEPASETEDDQDDCEEIDDRDASKDEAARDSRDDPDEDDYKWFDYENEKMYPNGDGEDEEPPLRAGNTRVDTRPLHVNRQFSTEALPIMYKTLTFVMDADGNECLKFFQALPKVGRKNITSIALTNAAVMSKNGPSRRTWSNARTWTLATRTWSDATTPLYQAKGLTLLTPFATLLAKNLPKLSEVSLFMPFGGFDESYCSMAPLELSLMLKHKRLKKLNFIFFGDKAADAITNHNSDECYKKLMGDWANGEKVARHEFLLQNPRQGGDERLTKPVGKKTLEWARMEEEYVKKYAEPFAWEWADRDLDMGACGNVQAVISCTKAV